MEQAEQIHKEQIVYFVNGEEQKTERSDLTVRQILEDAGFKPAKDYQLTDDATGHTYVDENEKVQLKDGERFTATFVGPTPTS